MGEGVAKKEMARRTGLSVPTVRKYLKMIEENQIFSWEREVWLSLISDPFEVAKDFVSGSANFLSGSSPSVKEAWNFIWGADCFSRYSKDLLPRLFDRPPGAPVTVLVAFPATPQGVPPPPKTPVLPYQYRGPV